MQRKARILVVVELLLFFAVITVLGCAGGRETYVVYESRPRAEIVVAEEPATVVPVAAGELQRIIEKMSGANLPIVTVPSGEEGKTRIYVGRSRHTDDLGIEVGDLDYDAFRMVSGENWLALLGRDDDFVLPEPYAASSQDVAQTLEEFKELTGLHVSRLPTSRVAWRQYSEDLDIYQQDGRGSANAVHAFLRDLGFRWYFPGEIGKVVPQHSSIALPDVNRTIRPDFRMRQFGQYYHGWGQPQATEEEIRWQLSLGINSGYQTRGLGAMGHGLSSITTGRYAFREGPQRDEFHAGHPEEFYALYGGERDIGANQCLSSEKLFETTVEYVRAMFDIYDVRLLDLSPEDGFSPLCECALCEGKDTPERGRSGTLSDHVWGFINRVAEEVYETHPDRLIGGLAYSSYLLPPEDIEELSPNVAVMTCKWRTWQPDRYSPEEVAELRRSWLDIMPSGEFYRWDYFLHSRGGSGIPVYFPRLIVDDLRSLEGLAGGEASEVFRNYDGWEREWHALATNHLNLYVTARYYWDVDQDLEELLDEYYDKFYGPAAEEMKEFVEYAEANWRDARDDPHVIDRLLEMIAEAAEAAGDSIYGERIDMIATYMQPLVELGEQLAAGREDPPTAHISERSEEDVELDGRIEGAFWDDIPGETLRNIETGEEPEKKTTFKLAWTEDDNLYLGIRCEESDMENLYVGSDKDGSFDIFQGDSVEILLETPDHRYYQIAISPAGAVVDLDRSRYTRDSWDSGIEVVTHHGEDYWSLEARIPVAGEGHYQFHPNEGVSGGRPTRTDPWYFNVCRVRMRRPNGTELSAFSPTHTSNFHEVMKFGKMYVR